jgi:hypothetical protein
VLIAVAYIACVITSWAFLSLGLDRDVIENPRAGYLLGPATVAASGIVVLVLARSTRTLVVPMIVTAATVYLGMLLVSAVAFAIVSGDPIAGVVFAAGQAQSPFVFLAAVLGAVALAVHRAMTIRSPA